MAQRNPSFRSRGGKGQQYQGNGSNRKKDDGFYLNKGLRLTVESGDITRLSGGAVVAGEDSEFNGKGAVAKALKKAGGLSYEYERRRMIDLVKRKKNRLVYYCPAGTVLKYNFVFYAITSQQGSHTTVDYNKMVELFECVARLAEEKSVTKLVTPLFGTGVAGGSVDDCLKAAVDGLSQIVPKYLQDVVIVGFNEKKASEIRDKLQRILETAANSEQAEMGDENFSPAGKGRPEGGYRQTKMHGGASAGHSSAAKHAPQTSQTQAGNRPSAAGNSTRKNAAKDTPFKGIVSERKKVFDKNPNDPYPPRPRTPHANPSGGKTFAQVVAGGKGKNSKSDTHQSPSSYDGNQTRPWKRPGGPNGNGKGERQWDDPPRSDTAHHHQNDTHSRPPASSFRAKEPKEQVSSSGETSQGSSTLQIVDMKKMRKQEEEEEEEEETSKTEEAAGKTESGSDKQNPPPTPSSRAKSPPRIIKSGNDDDDDNDDEDDDGRVEDNNGSISNVGGNDHTSSEQPRHSGHSGAHQHQRPHQDDDDSDDNNSKNGYNRDDDAGSSDVQSNHGSLDRKGDEIDRGSSEGRDVLAWQRGLEGASSPEQLRPREARFVGGGSEAEGKMVPDKKPLLNLAGYQDCGTIVIEYSFPNGTQGPQHPAPGQPYKGTFRRAFLPDNQEGQRVLERLRKAFDSKLTFQLVQTGPNGEWGVEFADIPHKTSLKGGRDGGGFPDNRYLRQVNSVLRKLGIQ